MIRSLFLIGLALGVACHTPARPGFPEGPLATPLAAWIPADAVMVIAIGEGGAAEIDALAGALQVPVPGKFAPPGGVWILLDGDASSTARCEAAAAAPVPDGATVSHSSGATLIELGDTTTVFRDGVACMVASGAASRRAHHAVRLAGLTDDERLVARADARAALAALPADAAVIAWGGGDVIGGGLGDDLAATLGAMGDLAIAVSIDPADGTLHLTAHPASAHPEPGPEGSEPERVAVGLHAQPPAPPPLPPLPLPPRDENTDVPESAEYRAAVQQLTRLLFAAAEIATEITTREDAATAAWVAAWGEATITRTPEAIELSWPPPVEPRARADAARDSLRVGLEDLYTRHAGSIAEADAMLPVLVRIRARDVAAFDRARR